MFFAINVKVRDIPLMSETCLHCVAPDQVRCYAVDMDPLPQANMGLGNQAPLLTRLRTSAR